LKKFLDVILCNIMMVPVSKDDKGEYMRLENLFVIPFSKRATKSTLLETMAMQRTTINKAVVISMM